MLQLTLAALKREASAFAQGESLHDEPSLHGVTDGKVVGTYFEHKFRSHLRTKYDFQHGSSAKGIDFPQLLVDMKVISIRQWRLQYRRVIEKADTVAGVARL